MHSGEQLGIVKYAQSRLAAEHAIVNHESFKEELRTQLPNTDFPILRLENGLKNMVHIMHNNRADFYLLKNALRTYIQRYDEWPIKDKFIFDAVLMRAFYFLDMPDEAVEVNAIIHGQMILDLIRFHFNIWSYSKIKCFPRSSIKPPATRSYWIYCMKARNMMKWYEFTTI